MQCGLPNIVDCPLLAEVGRSTPAADHRCEFARWSSSTSGMDDATTMMATEPSAVVSGRGGCGQVVGVCSALAPIEPSLDKARLLLAASADHCSSTGRTSPPVVVWVPDGQHRTSASTPTPDRCSLSNPVPGHYARPDRRLPSAGYTASSTGSRFRLPRCLHWPGQPLAGRLAASGLVPRLRHHVGRVRRKP